MPESTPPATSEPDGPGRSPPRLFEAAYDDLKRIAVGFCYRERADSTMQPTALVHEVYLRLINGGARSGKDANTSSQSPLASCARR